VMILLYDVYSVWLL